MHEIRNTLELMLERGLLIAQNPVVEKYHRGCVEVTWAPTPPGDLFRLQEHSLTTFMQRLEAKAYSAIMRDGALLQLHWVFEDDELVQHRLAYLPFPVDDADSMLDDELPVLEVLDYYLDNNAADNIRLRSPVRFDYDPNDKAPGHPAAHLTLNYSHCRIAISEPLDLGRFLKFVVMNFYPEWWRTHTFLREFRTTRAGPRCIEPAEEEHPHLGWRTPLAG